MPHIGTMTTSGQSLVGKRGCNFCPSAADNLVTACADERPDRQWAAMLVSRESDDHAVKVVFKRSRDRTRPAFLRFGGSLHVRIGRIQTAPGRRIEPRRSRRTALQVGRSAAAQTRSILLPWPPSRCSAAPPEHRKSCQIRSTGRFVPSP